MSRFAIQPSVKLFSPGRMVRCLLLLVLLSAPVLAVRAATTNSLVWNKDKEQITADVRDLELLSLLETIAGQTGWNIFVEPDYDYRASVKFKDLPTSQALRRLLGDMNFALMPQTNGPQRLYVFRTALGNAIQQVRSGGVRAAPKPKRIPNELIIRVKPGTDIEALAKLLGAKIVGRLPELNAYRLEFESEEAAEAARKKLLENPDVVGVEYNYYVDRPSIPQSLGGRPAPQPKINFNPVARDSGKVVVGLLDTALQKQTPELEQLIKARFSYAGEYAPNATTPTHADAMFNTMVQALEQVLNGSQTSVSFVPGDIFGNRATTDLFTALVAMDDLYKNHGVTVFNASFAGPGESQLMREYVKFLSDQGIPVFAAVGNDGSSTPMLPAAIPEAYAVTATERGGLASYVNVGTVPDLAAPGVVLFYFNGLVYASQGTSVSTAVATGAAAGIADRNGLPVSQAVPRLQQVLIVPGKK